MYWLNKINTSIHNRVSEEYFNLYMCENNITKKVLNLVVFYVYITPSQFTKLRYLCLFAYNGVFLCFVCLRSVSCAGADAGGRGAHPARAPPQIGKNMIFWRKIVIFHTKYPKNFRASLRNWKKYDLLA